MAGKRRSMEENLIEAVTYADNPKERLQAAEDVLAQRVDAIRAGREAINLVELGLSDEEIKWIDLQVGHALVRGSGDGNVAEQMTTTYPRMVLASLAGAAVRADSDATFWADWTRRVGLSAEESAGGTGSSTSQITDTISKAIVSMAQAAGLKTYGAEDTKDSEDSADSVVNLVRLHVGITASGVQTLVEAYLDEEISATRLALVLQRDDAAPWTLREFLSQEPELAAFFLSSATEFIDYTLDTPDWYAAERKDAFEGQADLPPLMFAELVHVLANRDEYGREGTPMERVFIRPRLWLDEVLGTVHLRLTLPTGEESADWVMSAPSGSRRIRQNADHSTVDQAGHDVNLAKPLPKFTVQLPAHGREWDMDLFHPDKPVIFFNVETGRRIARIRRLRATEVIALAPEQTTFLGDDGASVADQEQVTPVRAWSGWQMYRLNLSDTTSVDIRFDQIDTRLNVQLDRRLKMRFGTSNPVHGLVGPDGRPVFATSPTITIPASETGEWTRRIFYIYGDERQDVFGVPLICEIGETTDIFADTGDVWIGRFDVHVFHNGLFVASRIYNMAEDIALTFDYEDSELLGFRHPDSRPTGGGLTQASYQLNYVGEKDIELSDEWGVLDSDTVGVHEPLESGEGYGLDAIVVPERLTYRIDRLDRTASWRSFPEAVDTTVLDPGGDLTVLLPEPATGAQLTLVDLGRPQEGGRTVDLEAVTPTSFRSSTAALANFYHGAETMLLSLTWHPESAEVDIDGVDKPTARTRARVRAAAKKGTSANLALLTRQPLLAAAHVEDSTITVEAHQGSANLVVWAWPLRDLAAGPEELDLDPATLTAPVPDSLIDAGPLVVDAAETGFVLDPVAPLTPSDRAIVATSESTDEAAEAEGAGDAEEAQPEELPRFEAPGAWDAENLLASLARPGGGQALTELTRLTSARREALLREPRLSLSALGVSPLAAEDRMAAFISSGLVAANFEPGEEGDEIVADDEFWGGLLVSTGDLLGLARAGQADSTAATSALTHLRRLGGEGLVNTLRSGWAVGDTFASINKAERAFLGMYDGALLNGVPPVPQPWASENRRRQALTELYTRRHLIAHLGVVPALVEQAVRLENQVLKHVTSQVASMQATQRSDAQDQGDPVAEPWAWVPYVSTTLSFLARMRAHGLVGKIRGREATFTAWSRLAALVPQLTVTDIVLADATVASTQHGLEVPAAAVPEKAPVAEASVVEPEVVEPEVVEPKAPEPEARKEAEAPEEPVISVEPEPEPESEFVVPYVVKETAPKAKTESKPSSAAKKAAAPKVISVSEAAPEPAAKPAPEPAPEAVPKAAPAKAPTVAPEPEVTPAPEPTMKPRNRAVFDIHRTLVATLSEFVQAPLAEDASPEEMMLRSKFAGDLFERLRAYRLDIDDASQKQLDAMLKKAEVHTKTTGTTTKLEAFLQEEELRIGEG